ncbi:MAG: antitoxin Xre/MbcA/ParS toxin-binding domain-containing protein [Chthoniobacterales bacterium]
MKTKKKTARRSEISARVKETAAVYHPAMKLPEPPAIEKIAAKFGLRQETLSRMTGFSLRAVAAWSNGKTPSTPVRRALVEMDRLLDSLSRLMKPKDVGRWLKEPNPALDGSTPVQVIERGQTDRIWRLLYFLESGEPG